MKTHRTEQRSLCEHQQSQSMGASARVSSHLEVFNMLRCRSVSSISDVSEYTLRKNFAKQLHPTENFFGPMVVARVYGRSAEGVGEWVGPMRCLPDGSIIIVGRSELGRTDGIIVIIVIIVIIDGGERRRARRMPPRSRSGARRLRGR